MQNAFRSARCMVNTGYVSLYKTTLEDCPRPLAQSPALWPTEPLTLREDQAAGSEALVSVRSASPN